MQVPRAQKGQLSPKRHAIFAPLPGASEHSVIKCPGFPQRWQVYPAGGTPFAEEAEPDEAAGAAAVSPPILFLNAAAPRLWLTSDFAERGDESSDPSRDGSCSCNTNGAAFGFGFGFGRGLPGGVPEELAAAPLGFAPRKGAKIDPSA